MCETDETPETITPHCDACSILVIQNVPCHETGCSNSWIDPMTDKGYKRTCDWCGSEFVPEQKQQTFCEESCAESYQ